MMSHNIQEVKFSRITHFVLCTYMCTVCDVHQGTCQFVCSLGTHHHVPKDFCAEGETLQWNIPLSQFTHYGYSKRWITLGHMLQGLLTIQPQ